MAFFYCFCFYSLSELRPLLGHCRGLLEQSLLPIPLKKALKNSCFDSKMPSKRLSFHPSSCTIFQLQNAIVVRSITLLLANLSKFKKIFCSSAQDATVNSHPIVQPVEHPDQITEIFDTISYSKGASVLRMLEDFMGPEFFRIGVTRFLQKYK